MQIPHALAHLPHQAGRSGEGASACFHIAFILDEKTVCNGLPTSCRARRLLMRRRGGGRRRCVYPACLSRTGCPDHVLDNRFVRSGPGLQGRRNKNAFESVICGVVAAWFIQQLRDIAFGRAAYITLACTMCTSLDLGFAVAAALFVASALLGSWWNASLVALLRIHHPAVHALLGAPDPVRHAESSAHAVALLRFVASSDHARLADAEVSRHVAVLRGCMLIGALALTSALACLLAAPDPTATATFSCWSRP